MNTTITFYIFKLVYLGTKFRLNLTVLNFQIKLTQRLFRNKKNESYYRILHIQINLDSKFQLQKFWFLEQISPQKLYFRSKTEKIEYHYWILHIQIVLSTIFSLNWQLQFFGRNLPKKGSYFQSKTDNINTTIEFCIFESLFVSNLTLKKQLWIFGPSLL